MKILLYSGWATANIGDAGHTPGTLRYLESHVRDGNVTLWLSKTTDEWTATLKKRFHTLQIVQGGVSSDGIASTPELQTAFDRAELFIQNSGMHFNRFWPAPTPLVKTMLAHKKRVALYGQSFDGFDPADEPEMAKLLSQVDLISCRDNESYYYLRRIGVRPRTLAFGPDGCFGMDMRDDARADAFLASRGLKPKQFITITLRTNSPRKGATTGDALNPVHISEADAAQNDRWSASLREVISGWVERTGLPVLLAPEVDKEIDQAEKYLMQRLPDSIRKHVIPRDTFWQADEAASVYARARVVVAMEPHSPIIALAAGTPIIHYCSAKHGVKRWMFRDVGLPEWLIDIDQEPPSVVLKELEEIHNHYDLATTRVHRAMAFIDARSDELISRLTSP